MDLHVDLGQIIIAALVGSSAWLIRLQVSHFGKRLDRHDDLLTGLVADVQRLIGINIGHNEWIGGERRLKK